MNISKEQAAALTAVPGWIGFFHYTHHNLNPRTELHAKDFESHMDFFVSTRLDLDKTIYEQGGIVKWIGKSEWTGTKFTSGHEYLKAMTCDYQGIYEYPDPLFTENDSFTIDLFNDRAQYWSMGPEEEVKVTRYVNNMDGYKVVRKKENNGITWYGGMMLGEEGKPMLPPAGFLFSGERTWETPGNIFMYQWEFFPSNTPEADQMELFRKALLQFQAAANEFARTFINVVNVRQRYIKLIKTMSDDWMHQAKTGKITWGTAAKMANTNRNFILEASRKESVAVAKAWAESKKPEGLPFEKAIAKAMGDKYGGKTFSELTHAERTEIYKKVIQSSGKDNAISKSLPLFKAGGAALPLLSLSISIVKVWMAENKVSTTLEEIVGNAGGLAGAEAAAALGIVVLPAGSFAATTVLFVIGGVAGTIAFEAALDKSHDWFGQVVEVLSGE